VSVLPSSRRAGPTELTTKRSLLGDGEHAARIKPSTIPRERANIASTVAASRDRVKIEAESFESKRTPPAKPSDPRNARPGERTDASGESGRSEPVGERMKAPKSSALGARRGAMLS
jgi:hypothetical protein